MHNRALHDTLAAFVEEAAGQLAEEVAGGAQVPFELIEQGRASAPLYCYRPLSGAFIAERASLLGRLPSYPSAVAALRGLPSLATYLHARGSRVSSDARDRAESALHAFLTAVWLDATDFVFEPQRFAVAHAELERMAYDGHVLTTVLTAVDGLVIEAEGVELGDGLRLVRGTSLSDAPEELSADPYATVVVLRLESKPGEDGAAADPLSAAGRRLRRLQTALRLWEDAEPALGPTAWARTGEGPWLSIPLTTGMRRPLEDCLVAAEDEDPLRAFCALVARRTPRAGELAWALRRFELGCERSSALEALSDWILATRALLGDPAGPTIETAVPRLAAICAVAAEREALAARLRETFELEPGVVSGVVRLEPAVEARVAELGGNLRAVLRDLLCGHLEPDLRRTADVLLLEASATT